METEKQKDLSFYSEVWSRKDRVMKHPTIRWNGKEVEKSKLGFPEAVELVHDKQVKIEGLTNKVLYIESLYFFLDGKPYHLCGQNLSLSLEGGAAPLFHRRLTYDPTNPEATSVELNESLFLQHDSRCFSFFSWVFMFSAKAVVTYYVVDPKEFR